jgi:hypothetical protein
VTASVDIHSHPKQPETVQQCIELAGKTRASILEDKDSQITQLLNASKRVAPSGIP